MNFFVAEDRARRATVLLVCLYVLAIAAVVLSINAAFAYVAYFYESARPTASFDAEFSFLFPYVSVIVTLIILIGTASKANELRGGGTVLASMLGGRFLSDSPQDAAEARLKNVVEEMALAAGVKTPSICVLDEEPGINAFAAGTNNQDPVIGVTKGCLTLLTRDELQGIVGHEFSHILHNDTVLNVRAYAVIFGLLAISVIGSNLFEAAWYAEDRSSRQGGGAAIFAVIGGILLAAGWLGGVAGRMVRAAIVRQREFLADASAVQYTRNADSVASALYKMASYGSHLRHSTGEEAEHYLFGPGAGSAWGRFGLTRTHPKTVARIKAIRPGFEPSGSHDTPVEKLADDDEGFGTIVPPTVAVEDDLTAAVATVIQRDPHSPLAAELASVIPLAAAVADQDVAKASVNAKSAAQTETQAASARAAGDASSQPTHPTFAPPPPPPSAVAAKIPDSLHAAAGDAESAAAVCFALAAADLPPEAWTKVLASDADDATTGKVNAAVPVIRSLTLQPRMALMDIVVPAIQALPEDEQTALTEAVSALLSLTAQPDTIAMGVFWRLTRYLESTPPAGPKAATWDEGAKYVATLLGTVARLQYGHGLLAPKAYEDAGHAFAEFGPLPPMPEAHPAEVQTALTVLSAASPATRDKVVLAAARIVEGAQLPESLADLLLRMICDAAGRDIPDLIDRWV
ncbi:MAG: M48 family metalloprotease [Capsulimonadaceae bacterium]|nr:M48 family metalloprotease [Capsulimonadaceae bacterium]